MATRTALPQTTPGITARAAQQRLEAALQRYGFTVDDLGPTWRAFAELPTKGGVH
jgi:hypothetical protein